MRKLLAFAALAEIGTGLALMIDPALVVTLLLGMDVAGAGIPLGRSFGIALLSLGFACWPGEQSAAGSSPAFRGMLTYNMLLAGFLAYLFVVDHIGGVLLWPAVGLHAGVAILLVWTWRQKRRTKEFDR